MLNLATSTLLSAKQTLCQKGGLSYISRLPARKIAIFATKRSCDEYSAIEKITSSKKRFEARVFNPKWRGEPKLSQVKESASDLLSFNPDWIVAIGGGSVIDGAKIAWGLYENPNFDESRLAVAFSLPDLRKKAKFVAVPTTAGTGSEASSSAILTSEDGVEKIPVVTHDFLPDLAILDANLLANIPTNILIPSMLDALSHALEGYTSKMQNPLATNLVSHAIINILKSLKNISCDKEYEELALMGAYFAGIVQNINVVGPAHALAHNIPLISHGVATGFFTPEVIKIHCKRSNSLKHRYNDLATNIGYKNIESAIDEIYHNILPKIKVESKISAYTKLDSDSFLSYSQAAAKDKLSRFFPEEFSEDDFMSILEKCY